MVVALGQDRDHLLGGVLAVASVVMAVFSIVITRLQRGEIKVLISMARPQSCLRRRSPGLQESHLLMRA